jgi:hypothetical protein
MIKAKRIYLTSALALTLALAGCSNDSTDKAANTAPATAQSTASAVQTAAPVNEDALTGTVIETFDSGGYTYLHLDNGQEKIWVAIGQTPVEKGQEISLANGPVMRDFHSPSLDRTFAEIIFSPGMLGATANPHGSMTAAGGSTEESFMAALGSGAEGASAMDVAASTGGSSKAVVAAKEIQVAKAEGDLGRTVAEVFADADALNGQKVKVRGKVVKVSPGIMGVNWLHLQDGTGDPAKKSHDLVVTTDEMAAVDSVVVVEGTVAAKKDFGMGYYYDALVEKAVITQ